MAVVPKKRGRPSKADLAARAAAAVDARSDKEILTDLRERFDMLQLLTTGAVHGAVNSLTIAGAPGVGKTYSVTSILDNARETMNINSEVVHGTISPVNLYKMAYRHRNPGSVMVLDDVDEIFNNDEALSLLKALCDSGARRTVSWMKESNAILQDDVPQQFEFNGSVIAISNEDFQRVIDSGKSKYSQHIEALMSRSLYLDLRLHTRRELLVWIEYVAEANGIFAREGVNKQQGKAIIQFLRDNLDQLRELSLRTLTKSTTLIKLHKDKWPTAARILLLKNR
jgi:hypothetical protein